MRELLKKIEDNNILLEVVDGQLKVFAKNPEQHIDIINTIREKKKELIEFLLLNKVQENDAHAEQSIQKVNARENYPLSPSQRRLWILSQMEGGNVAYNLTGAYEFNGHLNLEAFELAFQQLIHRHESLRTYFKENEHGEIRQFVKPADEVNFRIAPQAVDNSNGTLSVLIQSEFNAAFNLKNAPLLRVGLFQRNDTQWIFTYVMHHIISDAWSMRILVKELLQVYNALVSKMSYALPPLRIQYTDYACWLEARSTNEEFLSHKSYWLKQFEDGIPILKLAGDYPRPISKSYHGAAVSKYVGADLTTQLKQTAHREGGTMFMVLLTVVTNLLYRYTGQEDIVIGTSIASRQQSDLEDQIGFFVNTLALRAKFSGGDNFIDLLNKIKKTTLNAYEHQAFPFDELVDALRLERDISRSSLFDVMVVYQNEQEGNSNGEAHTLVGLTATPYQGTNESISKFDLTFFFTEVNEGLHLNIVYNTDIFSVETIDLIASNLDNLMRTSVNQSDIPIRDLDYLDRSEKEKLIFSYGTSIVEYDVTQNIIRLFRDQVVRTPNRIAVVCQDKKLTYSELGDKVNRLSLYLKNECHLKANDSAGILLDRSENVVIAILGIMTCGAAYVAIEPETPSKRKEFIIKDAKVKVLITQAEYLFDVSFYHGHLFSIDIQLPSIAGDKLIDEPDINPEHLAYIVYTSGSTGQPKGVMISYSALLDYIHGIYEKTNIRECTTFGMISTISADLGNTVFYSALLTGGELHIFSISDIMTPSVMNRTRLDCLKIVPSHWKALQNGSELFTPVKCLIFGGEKLSHDMIEKLRKADVTCEIYNHYGPSETTVGKLINHLNIKTGEYTLSIGRPFCNSRVYILDQNNFLLPTGAVGEICIGGRGLALGYLNQPELTKQKFIQDPFRKEELMYRTGDLGKWLNDGNLEFMGRKDDQLKIRGYRIELGEIEAVLKKHSLIENAAVLCKTNADEDQILIAYINSTSNIDLSEVKSFLSEELPNYMLPHQYVLVESIPLTPNGKIDRKKLFDIAYKEVANKDMILNPRNTTEESVLLIWREVLNKENIGVLDNFFDLGGNSLKIVKMVWLIEKNMDKKIAVGMAFKHHNIESLAAYIDSIGSSVTAETDSEMGDSVALMENTLSLLNGDSYAE